MIRPILAAALGACSLLAFALLSGGSTSVAQDAETVQVRARLVVSGSIEFGLRASGRDLSPRSRFFPAGDRATGWLVSSPVSLANGAELQILARRHENRRVEFAVRAVEPRTVYAPRGRFFPANARVGVWLISTPVSIPPPPEPEVDETPEPETSADDSETPTVTTPPEQAEQSTPTGEVISFGHREGLIVEGNIVGDPDAPVLITEYGDPF
ncbi:MAG: hypothetical protein OXH38_03230 [Chloroflexi bacterium]|nr:hypothetical protein [Chloroflexota bacterium]